MRREFSKPIKREALKRAHGRCQAVGPMYGWPVGTGCTASLAYGVEFDHVILDANSKDNSLENCAAVCIKCHKWKTAKHDTPLAAKTVRQQDMGAGIRSSSHPMPGSRGTKWRKPMRGPAVLR